MWRYLDLRLLVFLGFVFSLSQSLRSFCKNRYWLFMLISGTCLIRLMNSYLIRLITQVANQIKYIYANYDLAPVLILTPLAGLKASDTSDKWGTCFPHYWGTTCPRTEAQLPCPPGAFSTLQSVRFTLSIKGQRSVAWCHPTENIWLI